MKKFKVGEIYNEGGIEIKITKRTAKTITFVFTKKNWYEQNIDASYRKKVQTCHSEHEMINLGAHWSAPSITA